MALASDMRRRLAHFARSAFVIFATIDVHLFSWFSRTAPAPSFGEKGRARLPRLKRMFKPNLSAGGSGARRAEVASQFQHMATAATAHVTASIAVERDVCSRSSATRILPRLKLDERRSQPRRRVLIPRSQ